MATTPTALDYAARALAALIGTQYFTSLLRTQSAASHFLGRAVTAEEALFFPALGGRNGAIGLALLTFSLRGDRWAAGVLYCCCTAIGFSDLWVCSTRRGKLGVHIVGTVVLGAVGTALLRAS